MFIFIFLSSTLTRTVKSYIWNGKSLLKLHPVRRYSFVWLVRKLRGALDNVDEAYAAVWAALRSIQLGSKYEDHKRWGKIAAKNGRHLKKTNSDLRYLELLSKVFQRYSLVSSFPLYILFRVQMLWLSSNSTGNISKALTQHTHPILWAEQTSHIQHTIIRLKIAIGAWLICFLSAARKKLPLILRYCMVSILRRQSLSHFEFATLRFHRGHD